MEFFVAFFGAIVGGAISLVTTLILQRREDRKHRNASANALTFRLMDAIEDLMKIHEHINECTKGKFERGDQSLCMKVLPIGGGSTQVIEYNSTELSILHRKEHNSLVTKLIELIRARNIAVKNLSGYNDMKAEIDELLSSIGAFKVDGERVVVQLDFKPADHPFLMGKIHKANALLRNLFELTSRAVPEGKEAILELSKVLPSYFPKGTNLKTISFVEPVSAPKGKQ